MRAAYKLYNIITLCNSERQVRIFTCKLNKPTVKSSVRCNTAGMCASPQTRSNSILTRRALYEIGTCVISRKPAAHRRQCKIRLTVDGRCTSVTSYKQALLVFARLLTHACGTIDFAFVHICIQRAEPHEREKRVSGKGCIDRSWR